MLALFYLSVSHVSLKPYGVICRVSSPRRKEKGKTKRTDETEIVLSHTQGRVPPGSHQVTRFQMDVTCIMYICFPREGVLRDCGGTIHIESKAVCSGCPAHLENVQLRCKCPVRRSGAESTKRAVKRACPQLRGSPHPAPFKLQRLHKSALPHRRDAVHLPKGLVVFFLFFCVFFFALNTKTTKISL